jgi:hypothetical protein
LEAPSIFNSDSKKEKIMTQLNQLYYVHIDDNPSSAVMKVLANETSIQAGGTYVALGFLGMQDCIVIVDDEGKAVTLPYDEDSFKIQ